MVKALDGVSGTGMIVIARKYGQLGNRLFLYAHLIAAARHYDVELRNPCFAEYASLFPSTRDDLWCRYDPNQLGANECGLAKGAGGPNGRLRLALMSIVQVGTKLANAIKLNRNPCHIIRLRSGEGCDLLGESFRDAVSSGRPVLIQGWEFRSEELFDRYQDDIREFFRIGETDRRRVDATMAEARHQSDVVVGVHIRRGDYETFLGGQYFFDDALYAAWMREVQSQYQAQRPGQRVRFIICSNESIDRSQFQGLDYSMGPGTAIQDMYTLAETDFMIGPPSTFTGWAAFMGRTPLVFMRSSSDTINIPDAVPEKAVA